MKKAHDADKSLDDALLSKIIGAGLITADEAQRAIPSFPKPAGEHCPHQRTGKGCTIYGRRPLNCRLWKCLWLDDPAGTADLRRPDRSHYVVDILQDFITVGDDQHEPMHIEVIQVWCDPDHPDAHRDPALRAYLNEQGKRGCAAIIRYDASNAFVLFPPTMTDNGQWHEYHTAMNERPHTPLETFTVLAASGIRP
jgi:hypothetical protein